MTQTKQVGHEPRATSRESRLAISIAVAALLWFAMFSPWTAPHVPFWPTMAASAIVLTTLAFLFGGRSANSLEHSNTQTLEHSNTRTLEHFLWGLAAAAVLWCVFWIGDKVSQVVFGFARPQVDAIYALKGGCPRVAIAALLLFVVGPAEEIFWRGYVQRTLGERFGANVGFAAATVVYALVHVWSFNFMLVAAAGVCGIFWGALYRFFPRRLPAWAISHALWDAAAFVAFPF